MFSKVCAAGLGLVLAIAVSGGGAWAQSAESEALGRQIAHTVLATVKLDAIIAQSLGDSAGGFSSVKSRPEWGPMLREAAVEEVHHDIPAFEALFGHALAQTMSLDELKVGAAILTDPSAVAAMSGQGSNGAKGISPAVERLVATPAGNGFVTKITNAQTLLVGVQDDFVAILMPGLLRRFADKVEAGETARKAKTGGAQD